MIVNSKNGSEMIYNDSLSNYKLQNLDSISIFFPKVTVASIAFYGKAAEFGILQIYPTNNSSKKGKISKNQANPTFDIVVSNKRDSLLFSFVKEIGIALERYFSSPSIATELNLLTHGEIIVSNRSVEISDLYQYKLIDFERVIISVNKISKDEKNTKYKITLVPKEP